MHTHAHTADQKRRTTKDERPVILVTTVDIGDGKSDKIEQFVALMLPLGLVEVSRTGIAAIARGPDGM